MSIFEGKRWCQLLNEAKSCMLVCLHASCSRWIINGTAGKLHIIYMHINDDWNMQFQLWLTVTWVYTSRPAPSVALYYRLLTASAHRCIVVECIVRAYFVLIYYLLVTCFISILTNNAIVLYYFVDSYKQLLLLHIMGIPAMMVMVPGGASCWRRHACTTTQLVMLLVRSFIYLYALMIETCTSSCDWQSSCGCIHHILLLPLL